MKQILLSALILLTPIHGYGMEDKRQRTTNKQIMKDSRSEEDNKHKNEDEDKEPPVGCCDQLLRFLLLHQRQHNHNPV